VKVAQSASALSFPCAQQIGANKRRACGPESQSEMRQFRDRNFVLGLGLKSLVSVLVLNFWSRVTSLVRVRSDSDSEAGVRGECSKTMDHTCDSGPISAATVDGRGNQLPARDANWRQRTKTKASTAGRCV